MRFGIMLRIYFFTYCEDIMHKICFKRFFSFFLSAALITACCIPAKADSVQERALTYTALGDSISTGYRLSNTENSYVSLFGKYLQTAPVNMGQNGLDSAGLLKKLNTNQKVINQIKKSDVVTISMGGNDMLTIFAQLKPTSITSLISAVSSIQNSSMQKKLNDGVGHFQANWPKIIERIKKLSPNAKIIVTTLINPYQGIEINVPLVYHFDFGNYSDQFVKKINAVIIKDAPTNYLVADSYTIFKSHADQHLTNANLSKLEFDPHPNISGHFLISQAHEAVKLDFTHDALEIDGPASVTISAYAPSANAQYEAKPLLTCFDSSASKPVITYSIADAGKTGASIDPSTGVLTVKNTGKVQLKAALSMPQTNLSAEGLITVHIAKAIPRENPQKHYLPYIAVAAAVAVVLAAVLLILLFRRIHSKHRTNS